MLGIAIDIGIQGIALHLEILKVLQLSDQSGCQWSLKLTAQGSQPLPMFLSPV
jgi:hypothetical protein